MSNFLIAYRKENGMPEFETQLNKEAPELNHNKHLIALVEFSTAEEVRQIAYEITTYVLENINGQAELSY